MLLHGRLDASASEAPTQLVAYPTTRQDTVDRRLLIYDGWSIARQPSLERVAGLHRGSSCTVQSGRTPPR